jgi:hypothetical protein
MAMHHVSVPNQKVHEQDLLLSHGEKEDCHTLTYGFTARNVLFHAVVLSSCQKDKTVQQK